MPLFDAFVGGFYEALAPIAGADTAVNIFTETKTEEGGAKHTTIYGTPGRALEATVGTVSCRGWFTQDERTWVVVGDTLYERTSAGVYVSRGMIVNDGKPVFFASNGQGGDQLGIVGGSQLKVLNLNTNVLSAAIALPFANPMSFVFQDAYGLINQADTPIVWFSALEDFTSWDALDFFARSGTSDNIVTLATTRDRVWVLGTATSTLYYNSGDVDTPWVPYPGTTMQLGIVSPWALAGDRDRLFWIATEANTTAHVVTAGADASPRAISTPPIDQFIGRCTTLADAEALIYGQHQHTFPIFTCPSSPDDITTYAYDVRENEWHARAGWNDAAGVFTRWPARGCTVAGQTVLVGDWATGGLYELDLQTFTDGGDTLVHERTAPYLGSSPQWMFFNQAQLLAQSGVGLTTGQGSDPQVELQISRDGAKTWVNAGLAPLGALGEYLTRTIWRRLGRVRQDLLVIRVRHTDPVQCCWTGLNVTFGAGTGQL